ncbi:MAG: hypothetical protein WCC69_08670 [Pirellulales bacterium]
MTTAAFPSAPARSVPVWLPWLAAPLFMLLPIGGCGLATRLHRPAAAQVAVRPTVASAGLNFVPLVPITRVVPATADHRQVAWGRTTN